MQITEKLLSLPPYLSTSWKNVTALQLENRPYGLMLIVELKSGRLIEIPELEEEIVKKIFHFHAKSIEQIEGQYKTGLSIIFPSTVGEISTILQHNPEQSNLPPIPTELLQKLISLTQNLVPDYFNHVGKPEPHCNCPHCQMLKMVLHPDSPENSDDEIVSDEELQFKSWDIKPQNEQLYIVTNPLDEKEHYAVFLGEPIGCTCGNTNCEHIQAVLRS